MSILVAMPLRPLRAITISFLAVLALNGCATNMIEGLKTSGQWLLSRDNDRPEDGDRHPERNDAALYSQYQTERALLLSANVPLKQPPTLNPTQLRQRVLKLAPLGSDIGKAKICLELNGFACAWLAPTHHVMGCDVYGAAADPSRVHISARNHAVTAVAVSARPAKAVSN